MHQLFIKMSSVFGLLVFVAISTADTAEKQPIALKGDPYARETAEQRDQRMAWWREAKFGMFIHWGIYAVPAGEHEGVRDAEWIMRRAKIPVKRYREYAREFTAEDYKPEAWVELAEMAGMRYIVITAKHHDGFALYPTEVSDWDVVDATPVKRDVLAPLAKATRAKGLKFGLYYSHSQDWVHPGGAKWRIAEGDGWDETHKGSYDEYLKKIAVPQVREILTRYQPDVLWWDTPHYMTAERAEPLAELLALRPGIIHNDRLGGGYHGDTETPENFIPPTGYPGRDWETCMTTNDNWGYVRDDNDWMTLDEVVFKLVDIVSKGGNYLLNVGPDASGNIPEPAVRLLTAVGKWMDANGEAIYGTQASPFSCRLPWGRCTRKADGGDTLLYLHVFNRPETGEVLLPGLQNKVLSASMLNDDQPLKVTTSAHGPRIRMTKHNKDTVSVTLKVRIMGSPEVRELPVLPDPDRVIRLTPGDAGVTGELKLMQHFGIDQISNWERSGDVISWEFEAGQSGTHQLRFKGAASEAGQVILVEGVGKLTCKVPKTSNMKREFKVVDVGEVKLEKGKTYRIRLQPMEDGWKSANVHSLELVPVD